MVAVLSILLLQAAAERLFGSSGDWQTFMTVNLPTYGAIWLQAGSIVLLALGTRASLLRVREYYADWRAAQWGELPELKATLRCQEPPLAGWNWLRRWWRLHPTSSERLMVLEYPGRLVRLAPDLPFVVGWLVAILGIAGFEMAGELAAGGGAPCERPQGQCVVMSAAIAQPTTLRENRSRTIARYSQPWAVGT
jgi:hypothetical protein